MDHSDHLGGAECRPPFYIIFILNIRLFMLSNSLASLPITIMPKEAYLLSFVVRKRSYIFFLVSAGVGGSTTLYFFSTALV